MKEIKTYIRTDRAGKVLDALSEAGLDHATVTNVTAIGASIDPDTAKEINDAIKSHAEAIEAEKKVKTGED